MNSDIVHRRENEVYLIVQKSEPNIANGDQKMYTTSEEFTWPLNASKLAGVNLTFPFERTDVNYSSMNMNQTIMRLSLLLLLCIPLCAVHAQVQKGELLEGKLVSSEFDKLIFYINAV